MRLVHTYGTAEAGTYDGVVHDRHRAVTHTRKIVHNRRDCRRSPSAPTPSAEKYRLSGDGHPTRPAPRPGFGPTGLA
jgi:hypothetical protein